jgi:XTP/dITP diphosphohydrolase
MSRVPDGHNLLIPQDAGLEFNPDETGTTFCENALIKARELHALLEKRRPHLYKTGDPVIADDSGICVDALDGRPGIFSARYVGRQEGTRDWGCGTAALGTRDCCPQSKRLDNPPCLLTNLPSPQCGSAAPPAPNAAMPHPQSPVPSPLLYPSRKKLEAAERNALLLDELGDITTRTARFVCAMVLLFTPDRFCAAQETFEGEIVSGPEFAKGTGGFGYDPVLFIPELGRTVAELSEEEKNTMSHRAKAGKIIANILEACW